MARVEIIESGRGGSIHYHEGEHRLAFHWEFGGGDAVALIFGPQIDHWPTHAPWAIGRQSEIYDFVARDVVRQKVPGGGYSVDLDSGTIEIWSSDRSFHAPAAGSSDALRVSLASAAVSPAASPHPSLQPPRPATAIPERDPHEELHDHLSVDARLRGAERLYEADPSFDITEVVAREIRNLHREADGLDRALRLAEAHDSAHVRRALLWASRNRTECAPHCARLLLRLTGVSGAPEAAADHVAERLGPHHNYLERAAAFDELYRLTGLTLSPD